MRLDLRIPIGVLLAVIGVLVALYGLVERPLRDGINVDLWWGLVLLVVGATFLAVARAHRT